MLLEDPLHYPAYIVLEELAYWFKDPDGIFIRDFQSDAFNSRLFELYLNVVFYELDFEMSREYNQPDFLLSKFGKEIAVEAVSIAETEDPLVKKAFNDEQMDEIRTHVLKVMPFKFARSLLKKSDIALNQRKFIIGNSIIPKTNHLSLRCKIILKNVYGLFKRSST